MGAAVAEATHVDSITRRGDACGAKGGRKDGPHVGGARDVPDRRRPPVSSRAEQCDRRNFTSRLGLLAAARATRLTGGLPHDYYVAGMHRRADFLVVASSCRDGGRNGSAIRSGSISRSESPIGE